VSEGVATVLFKPSPDVAAVLNHLLDVFERRDGAPKQAVRARLEQIAETLPGYYSQVDPHPRLVANEQFIALERQGWVHLAWQPAQTGHLLESVTLVTDHVETLYTLKPLPTGGLAGPGGKILPGATGGF
jgi:hypothetical protein